VVCSFYNSREYRPNKAKLRVFKIELKGIDEVLLDCDGSHCTMRGRFPACVKFCRTGALLYDEIDEVVRKKRELFRLREIRPEAKVRAPWAGVELREGRK